MVGNSPGRSQGERGRRKRFGDSGERVAAAYLEANGYNIRERNWSRREGEIDIIVEKDDTVVFVEVRSRRGRALGSPEESITARKRAHLLASATLYLQEHPEAPPNQRIDLVVLELDASGKVVRLEQIEGAIEGD